LFSLTSVAIRSRTNIAWVNRFFGLLDLEEETERVAKLERLYGCISSFLVDSVMRFVFQFTNSTVGFGFFSL
jgi:hypothetical protein